MTKTIQTTELRRLRSTKSEMLLVDVLPKDKFDKDHIDGAINAPLESPTFLETVEKAAGRKDKKIIVYCSGVGCNASAKAASKLTAAGYGDVTTYEGGLSAWRNETAGPALAESASGDNVTPRAADKAAATNWSGPYSGTVGTSETKPTADKTKK